MMSKIRVAVIENQDLSRLGLISVLEKVDDIDLVGDATNARQGLQILQKTKPDVAIVDIALPDMDGIELTQKFKVLQADWQAESTYVTILTMQDRSDSVLAAFAAGADSYILKDTCLDNLVQAIRVTSEGYSWIDPAIARFVIEQIRQSSANNSTNDKSKETVEIEAIAPEYQQILNSDPLTARELEVLELIVGGCSNAQIAEKLYITVGTVKTHVRSILNKLCASDRTQAAVRALRGGLVE